VGAGISYSFFKWGAYDTAFNLLGTGRMDLYLGLLLGNGWLF
jgi:hypothetical protein